MGNESFNVQNQGFAQTFDTPTPPEYKVKFHNDDYTTMEFVVAILISVFQKSLVEAEFLMKTVHKTGSAVVGIYTYDIAMTRTELATKAAQKAGFPLRITVEK